MARSYPCLSCSRILMSVLTYASPESVPERDLIRQLQTNGYAICFKAKDELQDAILRLTYENGCYLMKIYDEALAKLNGDKE